MAVEHLPPSATPADVAAAIRRDGCVVVDRRAPRAAMDRVLDELDPWLEATPTGDEFGGHRTRRTGGLVARSPASRELMMDPLVLGTAKEVLAQATSIQLHLTQLISIEPGEKAQSVHRDQWAFDFFPFPADFDVQCNTIWAMTDFTAANGGTRVLPGSHRFEDRLQLRDNDMESVEMEAGSVLLYTGKLYHGGGANRTEAVRRGINIAYCVSWVRQEENQYLSCPREVALGLPDDLLRLMGYARGAYALGYVDDTRDPLDALRGRGPGDRFGEEQDLARAREKLKRPLG
jgi:ectoine hydroxylase-related dioxygenase (phytanoyl-CoA dioxygenase family)